MNYRLGSTTLIAASLILTASCSRDKEPGPVELLGDATVNTEIELISTDNIDPTIWVSSESNDDPRSGGNPDPSMCSIVDGPGEIIKPDGNANAYLEPTNLYPVAKIKGYGVPTTVTCSGSGIDHFYIGTN